MTRFEDIEVIKKERKKERKKKKPRKKKLLKNDINLQVSNAFFIYIPSKSTSSVERRLYLDPLLSYWTQTKREEKEKR